MTAVVGNKYRKKGDRQAWTCTDVDPFVGITLALSGGFEVTLDEDEFEREWLPWRASARA